jgi:hypothetical protein
VYDKMRYKAIDKCHVSVEAFNRRSEQSALGTRAQMARSRGGDRGQKAPALRLGVSQYENESHSRCFVDGFDVGEEMRINYRKIYLSCG